MPGPGAQVDRVLLYLCTGQPIPPRLRSAGIISWGWKWILCPLWLPLILAAIGLLVKLAAPRAESDRYPAITLCN